MREAKRRLQEHVSRLAAFGLLAFGARQPRSVPGYSPPVKFRVAIISVVRADDPANLPVTEAAARPAAERGHAPPGRGEARPLI